MLSNLFLDALITLGLTVAVGLVIITILAIVLVVKAFRKAFTAIDKKEEKSDDQN